ncbi:MAG: ATP-binding cassette domain-containing protein [Planctomycetota bacterium]|nr:MAG: ATP-binding cassette domain-containing protein [Planctomycetota bacterium]
MEYAVQTFSLTKIFSDWWGRAKVIAVDNLNLQIRYNEVFGLLGPNGSGKTTTLKMLLGLLFPTKGKNIVLGGDCSNPKISARIGFLPEESYLYRYLTARETLDFYGRLFGLPPKVRKMRTEALLEMVGLKAVANRPVGTYSKGMARRIGLAQALINDPDLLMLDEPTTGLDPIGTRQIKDLILELVKRGKTILLCSHLLADVEDVCDRIAILYGGKIQSEGKVKDLLQQTNKKQITIDSISDTAVEKIKKIIQDEQTECVVTSPMDKLETFFIKTVAAAQQLASTTSGAVSTTQIGDFLTAKTPVENILDKLVAAPVFPETHAEPTKTKQVVPLDDSVSKPDDKLLGKLTTPPESVQPKPVIKTKPVEDNATKKPEQIKKNILDQLTDHATPQKEDKEQTHKREGDSKDA